MKKAVRGLYDEIRVTLALDRDAPRSNLEDTVAKIAREIQPRNSFILFAAGHGTSEDGRFYFIPLDYQSGVGKQGAIGQDRLQDWLTNRINAKRAIILLDTCESGALVAGHAHSRTDVPASEAAVGRLHEATGRPVLAAAAVGQFAHEGLIGVADERHGIFTGGASMRCARAIATATALLNCQSLWHTPKRCAQDRRRFGWTGTNCDFRTDLRQAGCAVWVAG